MLRVLVLIVALAAGCIVAIVVKEVYDALLGTAFPAGWLSSYEMAFLGLVPIVFLIFVVFVGPARRILRGKDPWEIREEKKEDTGILGRIRRFGP